MVNHADFYSLMGVAYRDALLISPRFVSEYTACVIGTLLTTGKVLLARHCRLCFI